MTRRVRWLVGLLLGVALFGGSTACSGGGSTASAPGTPDRLGTAVTDTPSRQVTKLLVVVVENHSLAQMRDGMPYTYRLAQRFGYATNFYALAHPSLPNYLAMAGGDTFGVTDDSPPDDHPVAGASVFGQALQHGHTAAVYAEGMPEPCATADGGEAYAVRHNPWAYFVDERAQCLEHDRSMARFDADVEAGRLPEAGMLVPDTCHDAHDCSLRVADAWFAERMRTIVAGPDWRAGRLAVVLTADEDDSEGGNRILTVVVHPSQRHHVVDRRLDHFSITRLYAEVLGEEPLRQAAQAPSLAEAFHLPVS
jgi:acid phosphatase